MTNKGKTVLIVEGDGECASFCSADLKKDGFKVNYVTTAEAAMQAINDGLRPDIIVTEMLLEHDDSGIVLCHWLRKQAATAKTPILMLSDVARSRGISFDLKTPAAREWIKADDFVDKPVREEQFLTHIHHLLGQPAVTPEETHHH